MQHIVLYHQPGRYAGWPANYGMWAWGNEVVVGFTLGYHQAHGPFHARDKSRPFTTMQARSGDGGLTWDVQPMPIRAPGNRAVSADEHMLPELSVQRALDAGQATLPTACPGGIHFTHPDFALMCARTGLGAGAGAWFYVSYDRCHHWDGPYTLPDFGLPGVEARTDYLVSASHACTLFLTASKVDGGEGQGVFCVRTDDGGKTFGFVSWVAQVHNAGDPTQHVIMPASVRLSRSRMLTAVRCRGEHGACWIDLHASDDDGATWQFCARPVPDTGRGGNPPTLTRLHDGRLCLTYGYRAVPYGIRARLSDDGGVTWSEPIVLRDDGGSHDLGYPRTLQRPDGKLVTVYYFSDRRGGEGYIAATIWDAMPDGESRPMLPSACPHPPRC